MPEIKICGKCQKGFTCIAESVTDCHCFDIRLSDAQRASLEKEYGDCLCANCLREIS